MNLLDQQTVILVTIVADPTDRTVLRKKMEVEDELSKVQFKITKELEVVLTLGKKSEGSNVYCTHCKDEQRLINIWGKVNTLTLRHCTQMLNSLTPKSVPEGTKKSEKNRRSLLRMVFHIGIDNFAYFWPIFIWCTFTVRYITTHQS